MRDPQQDLDELEKNGLLRRLRILESSRQPIVMIDGQQLVDFSSNDYLGLANDDDLKSAFQEAISRHGVGSGASRLVSGTMAPHIELEEKIASVKRAEAALTFSSGFGVATGVIPAIVGKGDVIILDKLCHASLIDGARLSGATMRIFPHNDLEKLKSHLQWAREKTGGKNRILILTESVFSMDGDIALLREICELKEKTGALLLVDEAHAFGILGPQGRGLAAELGLENRVDFQMGTFSKAVGLSGGYLCATRSWIDWLINRARSFVFSTAPSPALAETVSKSLDLVIGKRGDELRAGLWENVRVMNEEATSAILPVVLGSNEKALQMAECLREKGFLVPAIRYPTVPRNTARLRITLSAACPIGEVKRLRSTLESGV